MPALARPDVHRPNHVARTRPIDATDATARPLVLRVVLPTLSGAECVVKPERLPSGSYRIRYTDPWGRRRTVTRKTAADARAAYRRILGDMQRGEYTDPRKGRITFADWCDDWLAGARNLGTGGRDTYRRDLDRHILPELGKVPVGRLTPDDIDRYLTEKSQQPADPGRASDQRAAGPTDDAVGVHRKQGLSPSSVHRHYACGRVPLG